MRLVQVMIPAGKRRAVLDALDDAGVEYALTDEVSGREYTAIVSFPLPTEAVEPILERLREAGIERESYTVVLDAETVVSQKFERLSEEYAADEETSGRISRDELKTQAEQMAPELPTYVLLTVVSAVIATAGVLLDSAAVVVGSMVIAPLIGPAMAASVGTVLDDRDLFARGARLQLLGVLVAIFAAAGFAVVLKEVHLIPPMDVTTVGQVRERLLPDFLSLAVAIGAGVAGATSLRSGVSASLVGVMIAVALIPPTAVIGIGIAYGLPLVVLGASVLVLVNVLSINLAGTATLWYAGYRPEQWFRTDEARTATLQRVAVLVASIAVLSVFLGGVTYMSYTTAAIEDDMIAGVEDTVEEYPEATLVDVELVHEQNVYERAFDPRPERVVVTVARPPGESYPELPQRIATMLQNGDGLVVEVRYVDAVTVSARDDGVSQRATPLPSVTSRPENGLVARPA
ncbi:TIGR00341 family protein [Haloarchaeobius baliensis]|uniref:TIGR00341 family protein n=1 Tax=Haloarchaeobius baliensis TaxID=1670458 RepID=UPI003F881E12